MGRTAWIALVVVLAGAGAWWLLRDGEGGDRGYRLATVERGDLESLVSSTGTLDAVTTVQVGTQVSGIIAEILADFNDRVVAGQTIAMIDTTLLASAVRDAQAKLERAEAELAHAEREHRRIRDLYEDRLVAETEMNTAQYTLDVARADAKSARISLDRAIRNLDYATIRAPISGTVVERNVDVGQTVAASFSAPQLFLIANDLSRMQILAAVDESDIGRIAEGQAARFTVQAYPDESFTGTVRQVRLQSSTQENVVNYIVVIDVANPDLRLLPGMTATVDFIIERSTGVLKVANAALRFRPPADVMAEWQARRERERAARGGPAEGGPDTDAARAPAAGQEAGAPAQPPAGRAAGAGGAEGHGFRDGQRPRDMALLWYLDEDGRLSATPVRTGITDGQSTEIRGRNLQEGMQVVVGVTQGQESSSANPFQNQPRGGPPRPGGF